ncbi:hypothetical protein CCMSSC00406_0009463 [Pleurotus cornucopiae]|uniref:Uncharacterized protein n=1 Tax=Pleurotus cornucopiae TaxID=5321 RepID=A0ACB7J5C0_PLECO|nr:hypothetical protein CCMSSC00406_0009463 [Pleurotus cornucopiae]
MASNRRFHPYNPALKLHNRTRRALAMSRGPGLATQAPAVEPDVEMMEIDEPEPAAMPLLAQPPPPALIVDDDQRKIWVLVILYALDRLYNWID